MPRADARSGGAGVACGLARFPGGRDASASPSVVGAWREGRRAGRAEKHAAGNEVVLAAEYSSTCRRVLECFAASAFQDGGQPPSAFRDGMSRDEGEALSFR